MKPVIYWLGGWASSLDCWESLLRDRFPDFDHRFLDPHASLGKTPAGAGLPAEGGVAAAWSMGSLLAHRWIQEGAWPAKLPLLSLSPIFRFLRPEGFGQPVLTRMEKKLDTDREAVLRDFWRRMPKAAEIPAVWEELWLAGTRRYSTAALTEGLEFLRNTMVDPSALEILPSRWTLRAGSADLLAPAPAPETLPANAVLKTYAGGHLPFWECPREIHADLKGLLE